MAEDTPPRQMSLIPYEGYGQIVLRRGNSVVVQDPHSLQLSVRDQEPPDQRLELTPCPYCGCDTRGEHHQTSPSAQSASSGQHAFPDGSWMHPGYFGKLAASQQPSPISSTGPSTPRRGFVPAALRSGRSREVSGQDPPTGTEFLGSQPSSSAGQGISKSAFSPGYFERFFKEIRVLGRGGNGVVMLVEHVLDRVQLGRFACKRVPVGDDHDWLKKVLVEVKLLSEITHDNLVRYHWVWLEDYQPSKFGPSVPCLWMLQDYCNGGDLHSYVLGPQREGLDMKEAMKERARRKSKADASSPPPQDLRGPSKLTFDEIFGFFRDITSGLHHLHHKGYVHRDLKPSNCLLQRDGNRTRVLISDFGTIQETVAKRSSTGATGTISYCAPEVLMKDGHEGTFGEFTTKSDIFSLGMIVYFMCFGRLPYTNADDINEDSEDLDELRAEIMKWSGFDDETRARPDLPEKLYKYLKRLLHVDPNERPSTDDILASIKAPTGLPDVAASLVEENSARVSAIDSPKHPSSPRPTTRKPQQFRPGLSSLRHTSTETIRPTSPVRRSSNGTLSRASRPTSPTEASLIHRPRHIDLPPPSSPKEDHRQSPRLMLPPPPPGPLTLPNRILNTFHNPTLARIALFAAKMLALTLPCSPFAAEEWVLYPLLIFAALDLGFWGLGWREEAVVCGLHFGLVGLAVRKGRLCQGSAVVWEDL